MLPTTAVPGVVVGGTVPEETRGTEADSEGCVEACSLGSSAAVSGPDVSADIDLSMLSAGCFFEGCD